jgi:hypothetical protein
MAIGFFTTEIIPLQNGGHNGHYLVTVFHGNNSCYNIEKLLQKLMSQ